MRGKCERGRGSVNVAAARANVIRREAADGFVGEGERRGGNINADGAGAEVFAGDGCSQGTSFGPMAAISRRGQGGRIYNNTRTRERLRRKCVKPADLTTHSPSKICSRPRTATRPSRAFSHPLPEHFRSPTQPRRTPAGCAMHSPPTSQHIPRRKPAPAPAQRHALPEHFLTPSRPLPLPHAAPTHARRPHNPFPAKSLRSPPHSDTPFPSTFAPPRSADAHPQAAPCIPRRPHNTFPVEDLLPSPHSDAPCPSTFVPPRSAMHSPPTPQHIPHRRPSPVPAATRCLSFRSASGTKKRHRTVHVRCRMSRSTVVAVGHWGW